MEKSQDQNDLKYSYYQEYKNGRFNHSGKKLLGLAIATMIVIPLTKLLSCELRIMYELPQLIIAGINVC